MRRHLFYIVFLIVSNFLAPLTYASEEELQSLNTTVQYCGFEDKDENEDASTVSDGGDYSEEYVPSQSEQYDLEHVLKKMRGDRFGQLKEYPITAVPPLRIFAAEVIANNLKSHCDSVQYLKSVCKGLHLPADLETLIIRNIAIPAESFHIKFSRGYLTFGPCSSEFAPGLYGATEVVQEVLKRFFLHPQILMQKIPRLRLEKHPSNPVCPIIPQEISSLTQTRKLHVLNFNLGSLPIGMKEMQMLRNIYFENCSLSFFPSFIFTLQHITVVKIKGSQLSDLPPLGSLSQLVCLDLERNQIQVLPKDIGQLTSLQKLNLSNNCLESLPMEICKLANLTDLIIYGNPIETLDYGLLDLYKLQEFKVKWEGRPCKLDDQGKLINQRITARLPGSEKRGTFLTMLALIPKNLPTFANLPNRVE